LEDDHHEIDERFNLGSEESLNIRSRIHEQAADILVDGVTAHQPGNR